MAAPALKSEEDSRAARFNSIQARARHASSQNWRPAGSPTPGARGALGSQALSDEAISAPANNNAGFQPPANNSAHYRANKESFDARQMNRPLPEATITPRDETLESLRGDTGEAERIAAEDDAARATFLDEQRGQARKKQELQTFANAASAEQEKKERLKQRRKLSRGKEFIINTLGLSVDGITAAETTATMGVTTIWDWIPWVMTFTYWNVQMFYGYYLSGYFINGEESMIVPPLTWEGFFTWLDPTGEAIDQDVAAAGAKFLPISVLHGTLVIADVTLFITITVVLGLMGYILSLFYEAAQSSAAAVGVLYNAQAGGLPFFDIFKFLIGL